MIQRLKSEAGGALVEFALAFPIFLFVTFAVIELSLILIKKSQVEYALDRSFSAFAKERKSCAVTGGDAAGTLLSIIEPEFIKSGLNFDNFTCSEGAVPNFSVERRPEIIAANNTAEDQRETFSYRNLIVNYCFQTNCVTCGAIPYLGENLKVLKNTIQQPLYYYIGDSPNDPRSPAYKQCDE